MDIAGKITVNKKQYGKYIHQSKSGEISFGKKKKSWKIAFSSNNYEEVAGLNVLDSNVPDKEKFEQRISKTPLKLEMQLDEAEEKLKKIKEEMKINEVLGIKTPENEEKLGARRELLEKKIGIYREEYRNLGLPYRVADALSRISRNISEKAGSAAGFAANLLPSARERQKTEYVKMLDKKLSNELLRPGKPRPGQIEPLLFQAEKLNNVKT